LYELIVAVPAGIYLKYIHKNQAAIDTNIYKEYNIHKEQIEFSKIFNRQLLFIFKSKRKKVD